MPRHSRRKPFLFEPKQTKVLKQLLGNTLADCEKDAIITKLAEHVADYRQHAQRSSRKAQRRLDEVLAIANFASEFHGRLDRIQLIVEQQSSAPINWRYGDIDAPAPEQGLDLLGINDSDVEVAALLVHQAVAVLKRRVRGTPSVANVALQVLCADVGSDLKYASERSTAGQGNQSHLPEVLKVILQAAGVRPTRTAVNTALGFAANPTPNAP